MAADELGRAVHHELAGSAAAGPANVLSTAIRAPAAVAAVATLACRRRAAAGCSGSPVADVVGDCLDRAGSIAVSGPADGPGRARPRVESARPGASDRPLRAQRPLRRPAHLPLTFARKGGTAKFDGVDWDFEAGAPPIPPAPAASWRARCTSTPVRFSIIAAPASAPTSARPLPTPGGTTPVTSCSPRRSSATTRSTSARDRRRPPSNRDPSGGRRA